jgi:hypothetical protein
VKAYTYAYNANGQRTGVTVATGYTYNAANELTAVTGPAAGTYTYDANGNQSTGGRRTLSYNDRDQITAVNTEAAGYEDIDQAQRATLGARWFLNTILSGSGTIGGGLLSFASWILAPPTAGSTVPLTIAGGALFLALAYGTREAALGLRESGCLAVYQR